MTKKIKLFLICLALLGCATTTQFNCNLPEGKEYTCYTDKECSEYMKGYSSVVTHRMVDPDGWYPEKIQVVHINLWVDHKNFQILGKIVAERREGKDYIKVWTETYDIECNLLDKGYDEGYRK